MHTADLSRFPTTNLDSEVRLGFAHRVRFTRDAFDPANPALRDVFAGDADIATRRAIAFIDAGLMQATESEIANHLRAAFEAGGRAMPQLVEVVAVPGGETAKENHEIPDIVLQLVHHHRICRKSFVIAIGGGAMLDAVGYGAAIAHRGVRLVRMPSTVLAQDDAAMG
ncbi:MAG: 3-dehydroquinate synthase, partial [bacterium]